MWTIHEDTNSVEAVKQDRRTANTDLLFPNGLNQLRRRVEVLNFLEVPTKPHRDGSAVCQFRLASLHFHSRSN